MPYHIGDTRSYNVYDVGELANITESLQKDSESIENALLFGARRATKDLFVADNGYAALIQKNIYAEYDFATDGGAVGTVATRSVKVPKNSVILPGKLIVTTAFTSSGSATVAIGLAKLDGTAISTTALQAATAIGTLGTAGAHTINDNSGAGYNGLSTIDEDAYITFTIATAALTAGKAIVILPVVVPSVTTAAVEYE